MGQLAPCTFVFYHSASWTAVVLDFDSACFCRAFNNKGGIGFVS